MKRLGFAKATVVGSYSVAPIQNVGTKSNLSLSKVTLTVLSPIDGGKLISG